MGTQLKIAELNKEGISKIRNSEEKMGVQIMAFEPGSPLADLTDEQVAQVQSLEKELGVTLLVYKS